jgi:IS30 family transposase
MDFNKDEIEKLLNEGWSYGKIAKKYNTYKTKIYRFCVRHNLKSKYAKSNSILDFFKDFLDLWR